MNKKQFLNTYKKIDALETKKEESNSIYRSEHDERLIKEYHYAKFQKNLHNTQKNDKLKELINKEKWDDKDTEELLKSLR